MSQGKTNEEAVRNITDAIESVLMVRMAQFLSQPVPHEHNEDDLAGEESFRVKGPELIAV
jgi:predicted RNase H-like HicB family nuclease